MVEGLYAQVEASVEVGNVKEENIFEGLMPIVSQKCNIKGYSFTFIIFIVIIRKEAVCW